MEMLQSTIYHSVDFIGSRRLNQLSKAEDIQVQEVPQLVHVWNPSLVVVSHFTICSAWTW